MSALSVSSFTSGLSSTAGRFAPKPAMGRRPRLTQSWLLPRRFPWGCGCRDRTKGFRFPKAFRLLGLERFGVDAFEPTFLRVARAAKRRRRETGSGMRASSLLCSAWHSYTYLTGAFYLIMAVINILKYLIIYRTCPIYLNMFSYMHMHKGSLCGPLP